MGLFHTKFMINAMILTFEIVNIPYLDGDVPRRGSTVFISRKKFGSPECLVILLTSILKINCELLSF